MKKLLTAFLCFVLMMGCVNLTACGTKKDSTPEPLQPAATDFSYYPKLPEAKDKKIYTIDGNIMSQDELISVSCLQGLVARESSEIYIVTDADQGDKSNFKLWLTDLVDNYGYTAEKIDSVAAMMTKYKSYITDLGIVAYDAAKNTSEEGLNVATTVCSAEGYLPVETALLQKAQSEWGLGEIKVDTRETTEDGDYRDEKWSFSQYKDKLSKKILIHQDPQKHTLRDYAVATRAFCFFYDSIDDVRFITDVYQWADKDIPIIGWCEDELGYVALNSGFSKITIGADWSTNLTTLSAVRLENAIKQTKYTQEKIAAKQGKHYLAMVMSDGDNIQWMQTNLVYREEWYGSRFRGDFKMTWGANPSSADLIPSILQHVYNTATPKDEFITGVSGNGYINPTTYADLDTYVSRTDPYMARADLHYVDLLDGGVDTAAIKPYGDMPNIGGGVWKIGNRYVEGGGGVYWANDKPFITFRESMWTESPASMLGLANRINHYQTDPTKMEGYTVLNIHPWSHTMSDVKRFVEMLGEHVELVTAGELIEMVKTNVPHEDVNKLPEAEIPPVETPDYVLPGVTKGDLTLLTPRTEKVFDIASITSKFEKGGKSSVHGEGVCLEVQTPSTDIQSFVYAKFAVTEQNDKLVVSARRFVRPSEADAELCVKVVSEDGKVEYVRADGEKDDYVKIDTDAYKSPEFALTKYIGSTVTIAVGTRKGEHCAINDIRFVRASELFVLPTVSLDTLNALAPCTLYDFVHNADTKTILTNWQKVATAGSEVADHNEGVCLQFAGQNAAIDSPITIALYNRFALDAVHKTLTVTARTFAGQNGPTQGQEPQYIPQIIVRIIQVDGTFVDLPLAAVDSDTPTAFTFDLTEYADTTVGIAIGAGRGYHCAISAIKFS